MGAIELVEKSQLAERPAMRSGDTVRVHVKVREGDKERIQIFEGVVIGLHRGGTRASFTVRKVSFGQGVERIFPLHSPTIHKVEVVRSAKVRRAKLYYLRDLKGKAARMKDSAKANRQEAKDRTEVRLSTPFSLSSPSAFLTFLPTMVRVPAMRTLENTLRRVGFVHVAGVDEVGRGCLAGPVVAAAVVAAPGQTHSGRVRLEAGAGARARAASSSGSCATPSRGRSPRPSRPRSTRSIFTRRRCAPCSAPSWRWRPLPDIVLVDAFRIPELPMAQRGVVHGDRRCSAIAAASIVAKVTRDRQMLDLHGRDPRYGFDRHKGYATADHLDAVARFGYSDAHRRSFRPAMLFDTID